MVSNKNPKYIDEKDARLSCENIRYRSPVSKYKKYYNSAKNISELCQTGLIPLCLSYPRMCQVFLSALAGRCELLGEVWKKTGNEQLLFK